MSSLAVFFYQVPFIHRKDDWPVSLNRGLYDPQVLMFKAFLRTNQDNSHITSPNALQRSDCAVKLDALFDLALSTQTGSVNQKNLLAVVFQYRVDRISRRSRQISDDLAIFLQECVHK